MQIIVNSDNQVDGHEALAEAVRAEVGATVGRFAAELTRIEVHLGDVNADKQGEADKRCSIEARPAGMKPVAVEHRASTHEEAYSGAAEKLARLLDHQLGKRHQQKGAPSIRDNELR